MRLTITCGANLIQMFVARNGTVVGGLLSRLPISDGYPDCSAATNQSPQPRARTVVGDKKSLVSCPGLLKQ